MSYIGNQSENKVSPARMREYVTGDGSATTFDLSHDIPGYGAENLIVVVNNVIQEPATAYTITNDANGRPRRLDFGAGNVLATTDTCYVIYQATGQIYHTPPANSVGYSQLEANLRSGRVDQFAGSAGASSNTVFTLTESALNVNSIMVYVNGIYQRPTTNYTVSGTALTFTASLADTDEVDVHHMSIRSTVSHVADGSVTSAKLDDNLQVAGTLGVTGNATVTGNLTVNGATTTVNSTTVTVDDKNIELGSTASPSDSTADGGGITLKGATDKTITWVNSTDSWTFNQKVEATALKVTGNIEATTPTILVPANKQAILAVNTVADSDGNTRSPIARDGRTLHYYDFGDEAGTGTWANTGVATNVASGRRAETSSSHRMSLGTHGARTTTDNLGASYLWTNDNAVNDTRSSPGGDPIPAGTHGITMGCSFLVTQTNIGGIIYYGDNGVGNHFYARTNYNATGRIQIGEDNDSSDTWLHATSGDANLAARGYWFFVMAQTFITGDIYVSHNGSGWVCVRRGGAVVSPTATIFGVNGDGYDDNSAKHKYMNAFWCEGMMNESLIWAEWQWLKSKWYNASFAE